MALVIAVSSSGFYTEMNSSLPEKPSSKYKKISVPLGHFIWLLRQFLYRLNCPKKIDIVIKKRNPIIANTIFFALN